MTWLVGWVERSETHQCIVRGDRVMGIAALNPSYGIYQRFRIIASTLQAPPPAQAR